MKWHVLLLVFFVCYVHGSKLPFISLKGAPGVSYTFSEFLVDQNGMHPLSSSQNHNTSYFDSSPWSMEGCDQKRIIQWNQTYPMNPVVGSLLEYSITNIKGMISNHQDASIYITGSITTGGRIYKLLSSHTLQFRDEPHGAIMIHENAHQCIPLSDDNTLFKWFTSWIHGIYNRIVLIHM
jgi:hypothetical protein